MPNVADDDDLDRALDAARERGRRRAAEILRGGDMLEAAAFAERLGVSGAIVDAKRERREVLALDDAEGGVRFPAAQLDQDGTPFMVLPRLFELLSDSPWAVYRFLVQRHAALNGASARDCLKQGRADQVIEAAEGVAQGAFTYSAPDSGPPALRVGALTRRWKRLAWTAMEDLLSVEPHLQGRHRGHDGVEWRRLTKDHHRHGGVVADQGVGHGVVRR